MPAYPEIKFILRYPKHYNRTSSTEQRDYLGNLDIAQSFKTYPVDNYTKTANLHS